MTTQSPEDAQARFEAMLMQVLTTDERSREHRTAKDRHGVARQKAKVAKARFVQNRDRRPGKV